MTILQSGAIASTGGGYQIERSLRFNSADSAHLNRTLGTSNRRTFTFSTWIKRSVFASTQCIFGNINYSGGGSTNQQFYLGFTGSDQLDMFHYNNGTQNQVTSSAVYRDPSAWYHIVGAVDTTQATSSNRLKIYVNGSQVTTLATATYPAQNTDTFINANLATGIGRQFGTGISGSYYNDGYLTEIYFIDGQQLTPSDFGETDANTGVWKPKAYTGTYGTNGFYLKFADNSGTTSTTLGKDSSGNGNNWTPNNFSVTAGSGNDSLVDSPTSYGTDTGAGGEVRGNYCTLNPLQSGTTNLTLSNGNLSVSQGNTTSEITRGTIALPTTGKWYWEATVTSTSPSLPGIGIINIANTSAALAAGVYTYTGVASASYNNGSFVNYGATFTNGDVIGVAFDADAGTLVFYKNNSSQGTFASSLTATYAPAIVGRQNGTSGSCDVNFGQRAFAYTAPSGFKALCTQNLPTPTIGATSTTQAGKYFNPVLYTGNGSTQSITGVGFQPDWVWAKSRSNAANHRLFDAVRGASKILYSSLTNAEATDASGLTSFDTNGFSVGSTQVNDSGQTYVAWNWNAGGSNQTISVGQYSTSPNVPSIASTVRANTTSGFSIAIFTKNATNVTVGHGLGVTPAMIIVKGRGPSTSNWLVYHQNANATPQNGGLALEQTAAFTSNTGYWNNTSPTLNVFTVGSFMPNENSVAYSFAAVAGYSAFGSYTGNGAADGPFVYTGFRPRYVLIKRSDSTGNWDVFDTSRDPYNASGQVLYPNSSSAEQTFSPFGDILSNGFKIRNSAATDFNANGGTYIYAAFAETPFRYSLAR